MPGMEEVCDDIALAIAGIEIAGDHVYEVERVEDSALVVRLESGAEITIRIAYAE